MQTDGKQMNQQFHINLFVNDPNIFLKTISTYVCMYERIHACLIVSIIGLK